jgi:hypothetical protein
LFKSLAGIKKPFNSQNFFQRRSTSLRLEQQEPGSAPAQRSNHSSLPTAPSLPEHHHNRQELGIPRSFSFAHVVQKLKPQFCKSTKPTISLRTFRKEGQGLQEVMKILATKYHKTFPILENNSYKIQKNCFFAAFTRSS